MTRRQLKRIMEQTFAHVRLLSATKGEEYANDDNEALANFKRGAAIGVRPDQKCAIFFGKHYDSILSFIRRGKVFSEPIEGRVDDLILYLILFKAIVIESKQCGPTTKSSSSTRRRRLRN